MVKYRIKEKARWCRARDKYVSEFRPQRKWFDVVWLPIYDGEFFASFDTKEEAEVFIESLGKTPKITYHNLE